MVLPASSLATIKALRTALPPSARGVSDDVVLPEEVQGLRAFGSETETESIANVVARHLETMRNKHAITLEHLRMGALKGKILDADGSELVDLFDEFDITAQSVSFEFSTARGCSARASPRWRRWR